MSTTPSIPLPHDTSSEQTTTDSGYGWLLFATAMLGLAGIWNSFEGIYAIAKANFFIADAHYVFSDLRTWGWIMLILGASLLLATWRILTGSQWARWYAITAAALNAIAQLMFAQAYPLWTLTMFATDTLIIYALTKHAGPQLRRYEVP